MLARGQEEAEREIERGREREREREVRNKRKRIERGKRSNIAGRETVWEEHGGGSKVFSTCMSEQRKNERLIGGKVITSTFELDQPAGPGWWWWCVCAYHQVEL